MRRRGLLGVFGWLASLTCCGTQARPEASATSSADPVGSNSGVDRPTFQRVSPHPKQSPGRDSSHHRPGLRRRLAGHRARGDERVGGTVSDASSTRRRRPRYQARGRGGRQSLSGQCPAVPRIRTRQSRGPYSQPTAHSVGARWSPVGRYGDSQPGSASTAASGGGTSCSTATRPEICWS